MRDPKGPQPGPSHRPSLLASRFSMGTMADAITITRSPSLVADLVTLTKPRIISLLLVTTVAPMFITPVGLPSLGLIGWVTLAGYLMAGGANTINMWFDRDIDDRMARTRSRPIPSGRLPAAAALLFGISLGAAAFTHLLGVRQPVECLAGAVRPALLRVHLHHLAQAVEPAEHRDRRCRRCVPAAGGLGGDDQLGRSRRVVPLRDHLLLDPTALLGARTQQAGRLRRCRRPDDAQRARRSARPSARW